MHSHRYKSARGEHAATLAGTRKCTENRKNTSALLDCPQKANPETRHLSIQTWAATNLKGQRGAAREIIFLFHCTATVYLQSTNTKEPYGCHEGLQRQDVLWGLCYFRIKLPLTH